MGRRRNSCGKLLAGAFVLALIVPALAASCLWLSSELFPRLSGAYAAAGGAALLASVVLATWAVTSLHGFVRGTRRAAGSAAKVCPEAAGAATDEIELIAEAIGRLSERSTAKSREIKLLEARLAEATTCFREASAALDGMRCVVASAVVAASSGRMGELAQAVKTTMNVSEVAVVPREGDPFGSSGVDDGMLARLQELLAGPEVDCGVRLATPLIANSLSRCPSWVAAALGVLGADGGLIAPLRGPSKIEGVLLCACEGRRSLCRSDADLAATLSEIVALAVEEARFVQEARRSPKVDRETGLPGRAEFDGRLSEEVARASHVGGCCVALFGFEDAGEAKTATMFARVLGKAGSAVDFAFRLEDGLFAVVMGSRDVSEGRAFCKAVLRDWKDVWRVMGRELPVACGWAVCPSDGHTAEELMAVARAGLASARAGGGGICRFGEDES